MRIDLKGVWQKLLKAVERRPLSLAEKCRVTFGAAVVLVLTLALLLPYIWMGQLTKKSSLDAGRAKTETLLERHFQPKLSGESKLAALDNAGNVLDANDRQMRWIRFEKGDDKILAELEDQQRETIEALGSEEGINDNVVMTRKGGALYSSYVRIIRATDGCISCHNPQGTAAPFSQNEPIGAVIIERPAPEIGRMMLLNRTWIIMAGLIAGTGAVVAFYIITQRVILRPIRQLRALADNVAEGNLDIRSAIQTGDEYEKLARAFNHMLDRLEAIQDKLRKANKQLDEKILQLSERNIELFKANKVKSEFLANISHEFRTPLNAILGFAEILREKPDTLKTDKGRKYAENIITGGKELLNMINDLLSLAKTEAGKMELHIEQTSLQELCEGLVGTFAALTRKKKIKVKQSIDGNIPLLVTDGGKVRQILYNFLSNAVKFTPERGRIEIKAGMLENQMVRVSVSDTGCGIAEADKEKIFEKFRQVDGSITRETTGTGLGLAISKELAAMLAGSVGLESEVGRGATFYLDIPMNIKSDLSFSDSRDLATGGKEEPATS